MTDLTEINSVKSQADLLFSEQEVNAAYARMARSISDRLADSNPLILSVLTGGITPTAKILERLEFPLTLDIIHASRYRGETYGSELQWINVPQTSLAARTVLIIDDILDEGLTLQAILAYCIDQGADEVLSAVLVEKNLQRSKGCQADFVGLQAENRYLFGCGMDYHGYWRNLPGIYACKDS